MHFTLQTLARVQSRHWVLASILALLISPCVSAQTRRPSTSRRGGRTVAARRKPVGNGRIEVTAVATLNDGISKPVTNREFTLLAVDPDLLKKQVEKEIPLPDASADDAPKPLPASEQAAADVEQVAAEFHVSTGFVELAQEAPQAGSNYRDEDKYRRVEDYARVDEFRKIYDALIKKRAKRGNVAALSNTQKLDLVKMLDAEFDRLPPPDKMAIPIRLAQLVMERENQAFQRKRRQMEATQAALEKRSQRLSELCREMEKPWKAYRSTSNSKGVILFSKLPPGNYWVFADNFSFEGIISSWNIPVALKRNEIRRVEISMGDR